MEAARSPFCEAGGRRRGAPAALKARNATHRQERQHSAAEGRTRDRVRPARSSICGACAARGQGSSPKWAETCAAAGMTGQTKRRSRVLDATRPEPGPTTEFTVAGFAVWPRAAPRRASHGVSAFGNIGGTQLGTFSGLFAAKHPFCSRDFSFCSLRHSVRRCQMLSHI
jgi:hypothetical protein